MSYREREGERERVCVCGQMAITAIGRCDHDLRLKLTCHVMSWVGFGLGVIEQNLYNYNYVLLALSAILLSKRAIVHLVERSRSERRWELSLDVPNIIHLSILLIVVLIIVGNTAYLLTQLFINHSFSSFLFVVYPYVNEHRSTSLDQRASINEHRFQPNDHCVYVCVCVCACRTIGSLLCAIIASTRNHQGKMAGNEQRLIWSARNLQNIVHSALEFTYYVGLLPLEFIQV
jgi:hypothetical protein